MKIRIKDNLYEIDDEKGNKVEIPVNYLESIIKTLKIASTKITIPHAKSFEKFLINLERATSYYDLINEESIEYNNIIHIRQSESELKKNEKKAIKYDKRAQALFTMHKGWYENLPFIIQEIKNVFENNGKESINDTDILYTATLIDGILEKYRKELKQKTL